MVKKDDGYMEHACVLEHVFPWTRRLHKGRDAAIRAYVELCTKYGGEFDVRKGLWLVADYRPTGRAEDTWYLCFDLWVRDKDGKACLGRVTQIYTSDNVLTIELDGLIMDLKMPGLKEAKERWRSEAPSRR